jgi:hypothetical protein
MFNFHDEENIELYDISEIITKKWGEDDVEIKITVKPHQLNTAKATFFYKDMRLGYFSMTVKYLDADMIWERLQVHIKEDRLSESRGTDKVDNMIEWAKKIDSVRTAPTAFYIPAQDFTN